MKETNRNRDQKENDGVAANEKAIISPKTPECES